MKTTTITLNDKVYTVHYEYVEAEAETHDYPGTQPFVSIWKIESETDNDAMTEAEYFEIKDMCLSNEI